MIERLQSVANGIIAQAARSAVHSPASAGGGVRASYGGQCACQLRAVICAAIELRRHARRCYNKNA